MKDEKQDKLLVYCVIHRENLVTKNITPVTIEVLRSAIKCINAIKDEKQDKLLVYCVIHRENLVTKNITPVTIEVLRSAI